MTFYDVTQESIKDQPWYRVAATYFSECSPAIHQIDSYNLFMSKKLPKIITKSTFEYTKDGKCFVVHFEDPYIEKPQFTETNGITRPIRPNDSRTRNLSYMCKVYCHIVSHELNAEKIADTKVFREVYLGSVPCMVKSQYCNLHGKSKSSLYKNKEDPKDPGGYFIINGSEKVLLSQDRMAHNEIFVFKSKDKDTVKIPIPDSDKTASLSCDWSAEVRSYSSLYEPNITTTYMRLTERRLEKGEEELLYVELPGLKGPIEWITVFMAFGVTDVDEMISYVCDPDDIPLLTLLQPSLNTELQTQQEALEYMSTFVLAGQKDKKMAECKKILQHKLFQNVQSVKMKCYYLGDMTCKLLETALGRRKEDDRDHYAKKRVETAGNLINNLFKSIWKRIIRETCNNLTKKRGSDLAQLFYGKITNYIKPPFATGNWVATKGNNKPAKVGIAEILNRHNYVSMLSNLRRVITPSDKNSKIIKPRHLHCTHWYYICPAETPEGQKTGLVKNLSMLTSISKGTPEVVVMDWLRMHPEFANVIEDDEEATGEKVFINGSWRACTTNPEELVSTFRELRREGKINYEVSISQIKEGVRIHTDEGRLMAPFFIVENGSVKTLPENFTWMSLIEDGYVEYLDVSEAETLKHSYYPWKCEKADKHAFIHPCFMFGISACTAPLPDHNQSPRNAYQCLWEEEPVLMADGTKKKIKDVKVGDEVITFDPITFETSKTNVVNAYVKETDKKIVKITTITGRQIVVTEDHKMMTNRGWVEARDLDLVNDSLAVYLGKCSMDTNVDKYLIIEEYSLKKELYKRGVKESLINHHIKTLTNLGLIPLFSDSKILSIISRLFGFILTDGSVGIYRNSPRIQADFGSVYSATQFEDDIEMLGFNRTQIKKCVANYKGSTMTTYKINHENALASLLIGLGYSPGKLTTQPFIKLPKWIENGSNMIIREFLSGMQGGDGCQIRWNKNTNGHNFICGDTLKTIHNNYVQTLRDFMQQVCELYLKLDIDCKCVEYKAKYDNHTQCGIRIRCTKQNLQNYYNKVGYRYCDLKTINGGKVVEYLAYKDTLTKSYVEKLEKIRADFSTNLTNTEIGVKYGLETKKISDYRRSYNDGRCLTMRNLKQSEQPSAWNLQNKNEVIFVPIQTICEVENVKIADITTESDNHSFIGGDGFCVHNSSMGKQALGIYASNFLHRFDTSAHILAYPQRPLVDTCTMNLIGSPELPGGINLIVWVMCGGYNQEDSVIINRRAIDNGALRSINYCTYTESNHRRGNTIDTIKKPEKVTVKETRIKGYSKLDDDGISKENTPIAKRDVVIGKVNSTSEERDISTIVKTNGMEENSVVELNYDEPTYAVYKGSAVIDRAIITLNEDNYKTVRVRVRQNRVPQIGDKVASRAAQKGIIGMILPPEDMPFSEETGMTPDLIMNPNALPSRMTVAQIIECIMGKACAMNGAYGDATPFNPKYKQEIIAEELEKHGFNPHGDETAVNGMTGEKMQCLVFQGPTYYQRLKHMVDDKIHCLTPDHDVLTERGWIPITSVQKTDKVATLQDGKTVYTEPLQIWNYDYSGDIYHVCTEEVDLTVTPEHKMWVSVEGEYGLHKICDIIDINVSYSNMQNIMSVNKGCTTVNKYSGTVHCLEVPGNVFYVRRNGKPVWTGNSRDQDGPRETLTRQPVEGRKRGGGFRMGEMETWCGISHGASSFLIDRLVNNSDGYEKYVCNYCGNTAIASLKTKRFECKRCEQNTAISKIRIPYAFKLLQQELMACCIGVWYNVDETTELLPANTPSH